MTHIILNHYDWTWRGHLEFRRSIFTCVMVFKGWEDGCYHISHLRFWREPARWRDLDLLAAQGVVDHLMTPTWVKAWRYLRGKS